MPNNDGRPNLVAPAGHQALAWKAQPSAYGAEPVRPERPLALDRSWLELFVANAKLALAHGSKALDVLRVRVARGLYFAEWAADLAALNPDQKNEVCRWAFIVSGAQETDSTLVLGVQEVLFQYNIDLTVAKLRVHLGRAEERAKRELGAQSLDFGALVTTLTGSRQ